MKNNKITAEEQDKTDVVLRERLANENGRQHYVYHQHQADMNVHYVRGNPYVVSYRKHKWTGY